MYFGSEIARLCGNESAKPEKELTLISGYMPQWSLMSEITVIFPVTFIQRLESTSAGSDMRALFRGDDKQPSALMVKTGRLIRPRQDTSPSTVSPKLQLPAGKCRSYRGPPLQCPRSVVESRPIWAALCRAAKVHSVGQQLPFHAGPSGESVPFD